jgi:hypothetical protein
LYLADASAKKSLIISTSEDKLYKAPFMVEIILSCSPNFASNSLFCCWHIALTIAVNRWSSIGDCDGEGYIEELAPFPSCW